MARERVTKFTHVFSENYLPKSEAMCKVNTIWVKLQNPEEFFFQNAGNSNGDNGDKIALSCLSEDISDLALTFNPYNCSW